MRKRRLEVRAERVVYKNGIDIIVFDEASNAVLRPGFFEVIKEGAYCDAPSLELKVEEAQALMDELWRAGLRPTEGSGSAGSLSVCSRRAVSKSNERQRPERPGRRQ